MIYENDYQSAFCTPLEISSDCSRVRLYAKLIRPLSRSLPISSPASFLNRHEIAASAIEGTGRDDPHAPAQAESSRNRRGHPRRDDSPRLCTLHWIPGDSALCTEHMDTWRFCILHWRPGDSALYTEHIDKHICIGPNFLINFLIHFLTNLVDIV